MLIKLFEENSQRLQKSAISNDFLMDSRLDEAFKNCEFDWIRLNIWPKTGKIWKIRRFIGKLSFLKLYIHDPEPFVSCFF